MSNLTEIRWHGRGGQGAKVAYVSQNNIYVETLVDGSVIQLTKDGDEKIVNGTFDWVYEEEFGCRDGFRWSPDLTHKV